MEEASPGPVEESEWDSSAESGPRQSRTASTVRRLERLDEVLTTSAPSETKASDIAHIVQWQPELVYDDAGVTPESAAEELARFRLRAGGDVSADYRDGYRSWRLGRSTGATESSAGAAGCHPAVRREATMERAEDAARLLYPRLAPAERNTARYWWRYTVSYWVATCFMIGSVLFVAGAAFDYLSVRSHLDDPIRASATVQWPYFIGGLFFISGSYFGFFAAVNLGRREDAHPRYFVCVPLVPPRMDDGGAPPATDTENKKQLPGPVVRKMPWCWRLFWRRVAFADDETRDVLLSRQAAPRQQQRLASSDSSDTTADGTHTTASSAASSSEVITLANNNGANGANGSNGHGTTTPGGAAAGYQAAYPQRFFQAAGTTGLSPRLRTQVPRRDVPLAERGDDFALVGGGHNDEEDPDDDDDRRLDHEPPSAEEFFPIDPDAWHSYWGYLAYFVGALWFQVGILVDILEAHKVVSNEDGDAVKGSVPPGGLGDVVAGRSRRAVVLREDILSAVPATLGGVFFTVGALFAVHINESWRPSRMFSDVAWWVSNVNLLGSLLFLEAGIFLFDGLPEVAGVTSSFVVQLPYLVGSFFFFLAALLELFMWRVDLHGLSFVRAINKTTKLPDLMRAILTRDPVQASATSNFDDDVSGISLNQLGFVVAVILTYAFSLMDLVFAVGLAGCENGPNKVYGEHSASYDIYDSAVQSLICFGALALASVVHTVPRQRPFGMLLWTLRAAMLLLLIRYVWKFANSWRQAKHRC
mmetsp:Transcript_27231/g.88005  ORF Transcript_27231/g.88005 Transcript_27231/m.88005 type:complete len:760 (-) Transcript_27231:796-3075(-)